MRSFFKILFTPIPSRLSPWLLLWGFLACILFMDFFSEVAPSCDTKGIDVEMRLNEAQCVLDGYDPFLIWSGITPRREYVVWDFSHLLDGRRLNLIHAYPPWEYAFMMPLAFLPRPLARMVYRWLEYLVLFGLFACAFWTGMKMGGRGLVSAFIAFDATLLAVSAMSRCLVDENFGILITGAILAAIVCHWKEYDGVAGLFWAMTLVKPQIGLILFVPLFVRRKWRTMAISGIVIVCATILVSVICHRSPFDMVLAISEYSKGQFSGTGLIPPNLVARLIPYVGFETICLASMVLGVSMCFVCSWLLRPCQEPLFWICPAVICSTLWATSRLHDQSVHALAFLALVLALLRAQSARGMLIPAFVIIVMICRDLDDTIPIAVGIFKMSTFVLLPLLSSCFLRICACQLESVRVRH